MRNINMANERLNIPETLKVGFNNRPDTYSGKLADVTYINKKGDIAKATSWNGWIDKNIDVETYENKPIEGFVLNKRAGGYKSGWNFRQTKCRVYDPRGFEVEISVENLLYILQECTSSKGKGLEGEFVYAWSGTELILLPVCSEDYKASTELMERQEDITLKSLKVGAAYKGSAVDYLIYIGKMEWYVWHTVFGKGGAVWDEVKRVLLPTFVDLKNKKFLGYKNLKYLDYLIEEDAITPDDVQTYIENFKTTPAFTTQFVDKITIGKSLEGWEEYKNGSEKETPWPWHCHVNLYMQKPGEKNVTRIYGGKEKVYNGKTKYEWINANTNWNTTPEERARIEKEFHDNAIDEYDFEKVATLSYKDGKFKDEYSFYTGSKTINIEDEDWKYISDGTKICFTSKRDENERIIKWYASNLSKTSIDFNENAPLPEID